MPRTDEAQPASTTPPQRRFRRGLVISLLALVAVGVASFWLLPWLLMPEDLRRMQGEWKTVRVETKQGISREGGREDVVIIVGNRLRSGGAECCVHIDSRRRKLYVYSPHKVLGVNVAMPFWLLQPSWCDVYDYDISDGRLLLGLRGKLNVSTGVVSDGPWRNLHLERQ